MNLLGLIPSENINWEPNSSRVNTTPKCLFSQNLRRSTRKKTKRRGYWCTKCTYRRRVAGNRGKWHFARQFSGFLRRLSLRLRIAATFSAYLLRSILRRECATFCAALNGSPHPSGVGIMIVGHLQIMLIGDECAVADPFADNVQRKPHGEFGLPARPHVVEQSWPGLQSGPLDDPEQLRSQVGRLVPITSDDERPRIGRIPSRVQVRPQLGEQRNHTGLAPGVMFGLGATHGQAVDVLLRGTFSGHAKLQGRCEPLYVHCDWLWTFVDVAGVGPTNNAGERAVRHAVIWRKLSFGTQSAAGSRFVETIFTVVASCRQLRRNLFDVLRYCARCERRRRHDRVRN